MEVLNALVLICIVVATGAAIVAVVYVLLKQYFEQRNLEHEREWKEKKRKDYLPLQLQAFERLILYLERINPERLVFRVNKPGMSARQLQAEVLKIIRDEFDHNLAQQLYISPDAWESVKAAREETIRILNAAAERVNKDADSLTFSQAILEVSGKLETLPTDVAIRILKREFRARVGA